MHRPRRSAALAVSALALVAVAATACGSKSTSSPTSSTTTSTGAAGATGASGLVALLLPENDTTRYESADRPDFTAALSAACPKCTLTYGNAANSSATQLQQAQAALTKGAKVLVLDPVDGTTAGAIVALAKAKNVPVISYDRLITGGGALPDYYISFDNVKVGQLQGQALLTKLQSNGKQGKLIWINGSPTDNNATLFTQGAHSVIPKNGIDGFTIGYEIATPNWTPAVAQQEAAAAITRIGKNNIVGIYSSNDGMAAGIFAAEKAAGITDFPPMTGQDAQVDGIQRILAGQQYMTVYKAIKPEATDAAQLAVAVLSGQTPGTIAGLSQTQTTDGTTQVPSYLLTPVAVTKSNISSTVVADGFLTAAQICTSAYAQFCSAAGIS